MGREDITALSEGTDRHITISETLRKFLVGTGSASAEAALDDFSGAKPTTTKAKP